MSLAKRTFNSLKMMMNKTKLILTYDREKSIWAIYCKKATKCHAKLFLALGAVPHNAIRQHNSQCFTKPTDKNYHIKPRKTLEFFLFPNTFCSFSKRTNKNDNNNNIASFRTFERCSRLKR